VQDGVDVAFQPYDLPEGGEVLAQFPVIVQKSGWIAARAINEDRYLDGGAHTAPVWVFVGDRPICGAAEGAYYEEYLDALSQLIQAGVFPTGASEPEVLQQLAVAREIYTALKVCGSGDPPGVLRYGSSKRSLLGPVYLRGDRYPQPEHGGLRADDPQRAAERARSMDREREPGAVRCGARRPPAMGGAGRVDPAGPREFGRLREAARRPHA
jgi:hypothetical protein